MKLIKLIKALFYSPVLLLILVLYYLSKNKQLIDADIARLNINSSGVGVNPFCSLKGIN